MKNISGNRDNRIYKDNRGFTLLETLLVVAIIAVLLGLSIIGVIAIQKELRQRDLKTIAELLDGYNTRIFALVIENALDGCLRDGRQIG